MSDLLKSSLRRSSGPSTPSEIRQVRMLTPLPDSGGTTSEMTQGDIIRQSEHALKSILVGSIWYPFQKLCSLPAYSELLANEQKALNLLDADKDCPILDPDGYENYVSPTIQNLRKPELAPEPVRCKKNTSKPPSTESTNLTQTSSKKKRKKSNTPLAALLEHSAKKNVSAAKPTPQVLISLNERLRLEIESNQELEPHYGIQDLNDSFLAIRDEMATAKCASEILGMENVLMKLHSKISKPLARPDLYSQLLIRMQNDSDKVIHIMGPIGAEIRETVVAFSKSIAAQLFVVSGKIFIGDQLTKITRFCSDSDAQVTIVFLDHCEDHTETFSNHGGTQQMAKELVYLLEKSKQLPIFWVIGSENPSANIFERLRPHVLPDNCVYCLPPNLVSRQIFTQKLLGDHYHQFSDQVGESVCTNDELCKWISESSRLCAFSHIRNFCSKVATKKLENLETGLFEKIQPNDPRLRPNIDDLISCAFEVSEGKYHITFFKPENSPYISVLNQIVLVSARLSSQKRNPSTNGTLGKRPPETNPFQTNGSQSVPKRAAGQTNVDALTRAYQESREASLNFRRQPCIPPNTYAQQYQANEQQIVYE